MILDSLHERYAFPISIVVDVISTRTWRFFYFLFDRHCRLVASIRFVDHPSLFFVDSDRLVLDILHDTLLDCLEFVFADCAAFN